MEDRALFVGRNLDRLFRRWLVRGTALGALMFLLASFLDLYLVPSLYLRFLLYRLIVSACLVIVAVVAARRTDPLLHRALALLSVFISAVAVEAMILQYGGHASVYFAGMILLGVCVLSIFPVGMGFHAVAATLIWLVYLLPILLLDEIAGRGAFVAVNFFMVAIFATLLVLRHFTHRSLLDALSLRFDLERDRASLEKKVSEKTAELSRIVGALQREVKERSLAEVSLTHALYDWKKTFDTVKDAVVTVDAALTVVKANRSAGVLFGRDVERIEGVSLATLFASMGMADRRAPVSEMIMTLSHGEIEIPFGEDGAWYMVTADKILDASGAFDGAVVIFRETTELRRMQELISSGKKEWEDTFDVINDAITIHDSSFRIVRANRAAETLLGRDMNSILSTPCYGAYHGGDCPPEYCPSCLTLKTGKASTSEIFEPHLGKHLEIKALPKFSEEGDLLGLVHVARDITSRKEAEKRHDLLQSQLIHSQKMESIGRLAGGIAHDFNNILMAMLGYCEISMSQLPPGHRVREYLRIISESGEKAAALNRQLLAFGRKQVLQIQPVALGALVESAAKMLRRLIGEDITLEIAEGESVQVVNADPTQIEQIIMNLTVNARDAVKSGGTILIGVRNTKVGPDFGGLDFTGVPGSYVELFVSDDGSGMEDDVRQKIFEPFFTTKNVGEGTGLGLSMVYGIVQQHGGFVDVRSAPGEGTTMRVFLPVASSAQTLPAGEEGHPSLQGSETILVAEDEEHIRALIAEVLEEAGYRLILAGDGEEALALAAGFNGTIDLLVTDVVMPNLNGWALSQRFRRMFPDGRVLFMSGYTDDIVSRQGLGEDETLLMKPLRPSVLLKSIREVLDGRCAYPRRSQSPPLP